MSRIIPDGKGGFILELNPAPDPRTRDQTFLEGILANVTDHSRESTPKQCRSDQGTQRRAYNRDPCKFVFPENTAEKFKKAGGRRGLCEQSDALIQRAIDYFEANACFTYDKRVTGVSIVSKILGINHKSVMSASERAKAKGTPDSLPICCSDKKRTKKQRRQEAREAVPEFSRLTTKTVRRAIVKASSEGLSYSKIAKIFNVGISCVYTIMKRWNTEGTVERKRKATRKVNDALEQPETSSSPVDVKGDDSGGDDSGSDNSSSSSENLISSKTVEHPNSIVKEEPIPIDELFPAPLYHNGSFPSNFDHDYLSPLNTESATLSLPPKRSKMETVSALLDENNKRTDCEKSFVVKDEPSTQLQTSSSLVVKDEPSLIDELAAMIPAPSNHVNYLTSSNNEPFAPEKLRIEKDRNNEHKRTVHENSVVKDEEELTSSFPASSNHNGLLIPLNRDLPPSNPKRSRKQNVGVGDGADDRDLSLMDEDDFKILQKKKEAIEQFIVESVKKHPLKTPADVISEVFKKFNQTISYGNASTILKRHNSFKTISQKDLSQSKSS
ncbi:homeodomain-like domain-containing protein [Ditylenchus destructor]|nr:homeodomain-like domain-containing protein [Ditylenchus destructor]